MQALLTLILEKGLTLLASFLMSYFKFERKISKVQSKHRGQAEKVDEIVSAINERLKEGQRVPEPLWIALKDASYNLNSNFY